MPEQSDTIGQLAAALAAAQQKMDHASKDRNNSHFNNKYATLPSVIDAARTLAQHEIAVVQACGFDSDTGVATCRTTLMHSSGEWIAGTLSAPAHAVRGKFDKGDKPPEINAQSIGSALTYVRRYGLMGMVCIGPDDDDDGNAASGRDDNRQHTQQQRPAPKPATKPTPKPPPAPDKPAAPADWRAAGLAWLAERGITEAQVVAELGSTYDADALRALCKRHANTPKPPADEWGIPE